MTEKPNFLIELSLKMLFLFQDKYGYFSFFQTFQDEGISNYIVVYLRLLTSAQLEKKADFFENFIEGGRTVQEFRSQVKFIFNTDRLSRVRKSKLL